MATKPRKDDGAPELAPPAVFTTGMAGYKQVMAMSRQPRKASPELKALIARGKALLKSN